MPGSQQNMPILDAKLLDTDPGGCELLAALLAGRRRRPDDHPGLSGHALRWKVREATEIRKWQRVTVH
jgi:hypothetical protein